MRKFSIMLLATALVITSCTTSKPTSSTASPVAKVAKAQKPVEHLYIYSYTLEGGDSTLKFEDDNLSFRFLVGNKEVDFTVKNKSNQPQRILWDETSLVVFGEAKKVMHKGVKYADRNSSQPPTTIPPQASLDDLVLPSDNVYYREGYYGTYVRTAGGWETRDMLFGSDNADPKTRDLIQTLVGTKISLYMPVENTDGKKQHYNFVFVVREVKCITCKDAPPAPVQVNG